MDAWNTKTFPFGMAKKKLEVSIFKRTWLVLQGKFDGKQGLQRISPLNITIDKKAKNNILSPWDDVKNSWTMKPFYQSMMFDKLPKHRYDDN